VCADAERASQTWRNAHEDAARGRGDEVVAHERTAFRVRSIEAGQKPPSQDGPRGFVRLAFSAAQFLKAIPLRRSWAVTLDAVGVVSSWLRPAQSGDGLEPA